MGKLHQAVLNKDFKQFKKRLQQDDDINAVDKDGNTALMIAVRAGYLGFIKHCLALDAKTNIKNNDDETALSIAEKKRSFHTTKRLLITHLATKYDYIEVDEEDDNQTIINKLITTLLYKAKRYEWNSSDCVRIRSYISVLDISTKDFNETEMTKYIERQETKHREFYGSYLSDDSDSEHEENHSKFSREKKKTIHSKAVKFQRRGQIDNLFYQRKYRNNSKGDLKKVLAGSSIFDLTARTKIHYSDKKKENKVARDLRHFNRYLAQGMNLQEAQDKIETKFFVAQYRSNIYLTSKWNESRVLHRKQDEKDKPQYSASVLKEANINLYDDYENAVQQLEEKKDEVKLHAETLREILLTLREPCPCSYEGYSYLSVANLLQSIYTQDYDAFHELLETDDLLQQLFNGANPFVSTGDTPYHALKYGYGIKPYKGHEDERLRPRWQSNGKAERPYSGATYVSLHPITDYDKDGPLHLVSLNRAGDIKIKDKLNVIAERESCFPGFIPEDRVIYKHIAKYPSVKENYKEIYNEKYGISKEFYEKLKEKFEAASPHTQEMTEFKKLLGEWLCSYHEVKLIAKAKKTAKEKEGVIVYRDINGQFCLQPPIDSINRNTKEMTTKIKKPIKEKQKKLAALAPDIDKEIKIFRKERTIKSIIELHDSALYEDNERLCIKQSLLINAVNNQRYLALKKYIHLKSFKHALNNTFNHNELGEETSLLDMAIFKQDINAVKLLVNSPYVDLTKLHLLHLTVTHGNIEILKVLLEKGLTLEKNEPGDTPLDLARKNKQSEMVKLLQPLKKGASTLFFKKVKTEAKKTHKVKNKYEKRSRTTCAA